LGPKDSIRLFLLFETATFAIAALIHSGVLVTGFEHSGARMGEAVIAAVLVVGLALSLIRASLIRSIGIGAQGFALLGTFVGLITIAIGVGPRTVPDVAYHVSIVVVLFWGLVVAVRARYLYSARRLTPALAKARTPPHERAHPPAHVRARPCLFGDVGTTGAFAAGHSVLIGGTPQSASFTPATIRQRVLRQRPKRRRPSQPLPRSARPPRHPSRARRSCRSSRSIV